MILIFDNNQHRLNRLCKDIRYSDLPVKGASYEDWEYYTKPIVTILIFPKPSEIKYFTDVLSRQNTVCVLVLKKDIPEKRYSKNFIISPDGMITPSQIKEIIQREYQYTFHSDFINYILIDEEEEDIYFGYRQLFLLKREYSIVRFFAYNRKKIFSIDDIFDYLHLKIKEDTFLKYISAINIKCLRQYRENIIIKNNFGYGISPVTGNLQKKKSVGKRPTK